MVIINMAVYGYARVSTTDQDLSIQQDALLASGCEIVRSEKVSGTSRQRRAELRNLLDRMLDKRALKCITLQVTNTSIAAYKNSRHFN